MQTVHEWVREQLFALQDLSYKAFHTRLMPGVDPDTVIGVRTPALRKLARELAKRPDADEFISTLPHRYYEENNLHGFLLERIRDVPALIAALDRFLPYVNNWATCDLISPKAFQKDLPRLWEQIPVWLASDHVYTIRFGIGMLLSFYLDEHFTPECPELVAGVRSDEYYVNMMIAWYFATALAKQPQAAIGYLENRRLDQWVHNKAIQKAIESRRISDGEKDYLRSLRIK